MYIFPKENVGLTGCSVSEDPAKTNRQKSTNFRSYLQKLNVFFPRAPMCVCECVCVRWCVLVIVGFNFNGQDKDATTSYKRTRCPALSVVINGVHHIKQIAAYKNQLIPNELSTTRALVCFG